MGEGGGEGKETAEGYVSFFGRGLWLMLVEINEEEEEEEEL